MTLTELAEEALRDARLAARGEQLFLLRRGYKPKAYTQDGLNEFSFLYGRFHALANLDGWESERIPSPIDVRGDAAREAYDQFTDEIREGNTHDHKWR